MSVTWTEGLEQLTMYVYDPEAQEVPVNPPGGRSPKGLPYPERHRGGITGQRTGEPGTGNQGEPYRGARDIQG